MPDKIQTAFSPPQRNSEAMSSFGFRLHNQFHSNDVYRRPKELEWLESLRQYKGIYDPQVKIQENCSRAYPKITRSKVNIVLSRLHEMLFPETDKNWEIEPTPEPRIAREIIAQIVQTLIAQSVQTDPQTGQQTPPVMPSMDDVRLAIKKYAAETCAKMASVIDDQLIEMDYSEETKKVIRSALMYGTGVMKGPMINKRTKRTWEPNESSGEYEENEEQEDVPFFEFVRLWDFYPDLSVTDFDKMTGSFQRHIMRKHDLRELMKRPDFYSDIIKTFLSNYPNGNYAPKNWEVELQVIEAEAGATGETSPASQTATTGDTDEYTGATSRQTGTRYEVLEFWGYVDGMDLEACGVEVDDVTLEYGANIWMLGKKIIKATLFDSALDHYKVFYYEKDETSIFGEGLARVMRHSQLAIAAAARMVLDNGAICAGPQVEVNWSMLTPDTDVNDFYSRKIWFREGKGVDAQYPAIRVLNIDSHIPELLSIVQAFKQFGDEETTLPTWMIGQMASNETAQATSGRMSMITVSIKDVVKNFDAFSERIIRDLYAWNMEFNPRPDIKGDFKVNARGVSSLVMKEVRSQNLTQLKTTMTPEDWLYVSRRDFLAETLKAHDMDVPLRTEEEAQKIAASQQDTKALDLAYRMQEAEIAYKKSQTMAQLTKAKEHNVKAVKEAQTPPETAPSEDPRLADTEVAKAETELGAKQAEIRRQEEAHALDMQDKQLAMQHKEKAHRMEMSTKAVKTASETEIAHEKAAHDMEMKNKMTEAGAKAKIAAAKQKPKAAPKAPAAAKNPKPAKKAK
jgi:hypothetical protein